MAVEIKELHVKMSIRGDSSSRESSTNPKNLKEELENYCKRIVKDMIDRQKER